MNDHETIRELLPLAAAGALDPGDARRVEQHLAACAACAAEMEEWRELATGLRRLPTLQPRPEVVERTRAALEWRTALEVERRGNRIALAFGIAVSWTATLSGCVLVRLFSEGPRFAMNLFGGSTWIWLVGYTALAWVTAAAAALILAMRRRPERRTA